MNPFLGDGPRFHKRPLDTDGGQNFIFGNVQHPQKKNRLGRPFSSSPEFVSELCVQCRANLVSHRQVTNVEDVNPQR